MAAAAGVAALVWSAAANGDASDGLKWAYGSGMAGCANSGFVYASKAAALAALKSCLTSVVGGAACTLTQTNITGTVSGSVTFSISGEGCFAAGSTAAGIYNSTGCVAADFEPGGLCALPSCAGYEGASMPYFWRLGTAAETPESLCHAGSGCEATLLSRTCTGGECAASYTIGARIPCGDPSEATNETSNGGDGEECVGGTPVEFCMTDPKVNCGYVNDEYACLPKAADGTKCWEPMSGAMICREGTPMPPAPDNGTAGQPATPDAQVQNTGPSGVTNTYNYYNSTTVANSDRPAGGENPGAGDDGGTCEGEDCGGGEASGGDTCDAPPSCSGDAILCVSLKQHWLARCPGAVTDAQVDGALGENAAIPSEEHDFTSAVSTSLVSAGSGTCPAAPEIALPGGGTVAITVITWFCELAGRIAPLIMMAAYVAAAMIVAGRL